LGIAVEFVGANTSVKDFCSTHNTWILIHKFVTFYPDYYYNLQMNYHNNKNILCMNHYRRGIWGACNMELVAGNCIIDKLLHFDSCSRQSSCKGRDRIHLACKWSCWRQWEYLLEKKDLSRCHMCPYCCYSRDNKSYIGNDQSRTESDHRLIEHRLGIKKIMRILQNPFSWSHGKNRMQPKKIKLRRFINLNKLVS
jgi:hypothetical protein